MPEKQESRRKRFGAIMSLAEDHLDLIWPSGQYEGSTPWSNVTGLTQ